MGSKGESEFLKTTILVRSLGERPSPGSPRLREGLEINSQYRLRELCPIPSWEKKRLMLLSLTHQGRRHHRTEKLRLSSPRGSQRPGPSLSPAHPGKPEPEVPSPTLALHQCNGKPSLSFLAPDSRFLWMSNPERVTAWALLTAQWAVESEPKM